ncbi:NAD(P)H nitroreductase [Aliiglaciecola sp. CAU 1673]|uniref:NAD(P)H nitroreductase n=1 Tax=Aliiglaciecola sp. CAU 1673 TaxID=3032595 RepID=UPI0023DAE9B2|nr:NAD(P)H nitroreductase [Aliiglaciecola sp. CAU 1673]MDF2180413.1 NAD(P)H nitroreductase [Aliiglaciecola sp. CAU 1673]
MQALELLLNRQSQPRLQEPAPSGPALDNIFRAALRAPDHGNLTPWRFIVCKGKGLTKLGEIFEQGAIAADMSEKDIERAPSLPLRAPMVIIAITQYKEHAKVPWIEQVASTACAVQAMQMAAFAQGFGGIWRTGSYAQNEEVKNAFKLAEQDEIVGFLYLGTSVIPNSPQPSRDPNSYFEFLSE